MRSINPSTRLRSLRINSERSRTIKFYTLGCKVNQYDTQQMREQFLSAGLREIDNGIKADVYLVNTCTVTHRADAHSLNLIRRARRENPKAKIIVTGCLSRLDADKIKHIEPRALIIKKKDKEGISYFQGHTRAFLKIQDGCNNFCSYCKVPLVRGSSRSKALREIVMEAKALAANGYKEIVLTGICLGAYGRDLKSKAGLSDAIAALGKINGLSRLRLSSIEMQDVSDELLGMFSESGILCPHLHIPLQSGDDGILKMMQRRYSRQDYLCLIKKIKDKAPGIAITTDVLVGFPAESEDNFRNTIDLIREVMPLKVHIFPYSPRKGTPAFDLKGRIDSRAVKKRALALQAVAGLCALSYKKQFSGRKMDVLIEERCAGHLDLWQGYTGNYIRVRVKSARDLKNRVLSVRLKRVNRDYALADSYLQLKD